MSPREEQKDLALGLEQHRIRSHSMWIFACWLSVVAENSGEKTAILRLSQKIPSITTHNLLKSQLLCSSAAMTYRYPSMYDAWCDIRVCSTTGLSGGQAYEDP